MATSTSTSTSSTTTTTAGSTTTTSTTTTVAPSASPYVEYISDCDRPIVLSVAGSIPRNDWNVCAGFAFGSDSPAETFQLVALGRLQLAGNVNAHSVRFYQNLEIKAVTTVSNPAGRTGWRYTRLVTPVTITGGGEYELFSSELSGGDTFYDYENNFVTTAFGTINYPMYQEGCTGNFNAPISSPVSYGGVNALYRSTPTCNGVATTRGTLTAATPITGIAGSSTAVAGYTASLKGRGVLSGSVVSGVAALVGTLSSTFHISGVCNGQAGTTSVSSLLGAGSLSNQATKIFGIAVVIGGVNATSSASGTIAGAGVVIGGVNAIGSASGIAAGAGTAQATLLGSTSNSLTGQSSGSSGYSGLLVGSGRLLGSAAATSTTLLSISVIQGQLSGTAIGLAEVYSLDSSSTGQLAGQEAGVASVAPLLLTGVGGLIGSAGGAGDVYGTFAGSVEISASAAGEATVVGEIAGGTTTTTSSTTSTTTTTSSTTTSTTTSSTTTSSSTTTTPAPYIEYISNVDVNLVTMSEQGFLRNDITTCVGFKFSIAQPINVVALGRMESLGNAAIHGVYVKNTAGVALISGSVASPVNRAGWRFTPVSVVSLPAGTYHLFSSETLSGDFWSNDAETRIALSTGTPLNSAFQLSCANTVYAGKSGNYSYGGTNLKYRHIPTCNGVASCTGTITGSAQVVGGSSGTAVARAFFTISGRVNGVSDTYGAFGGIQFLASVIHCSAGYVAALTGEGALGGVTAGLAAVSALLTYEAATGLSTGEATVEGELTIYAYGNVAAGSSTVTGWMGASTTGLAAGVAHCCVYLEADDLLHYNLRVLHVFQLTPLETEIWFEGEVSGNSTQWVSSIADLNGNTCSLTPGETYIFQIQAVNADGASEYTSSDPIVMLDPEFALPNGVATVDQVVVAGTSAVIVWSYVPAVDSGDPTAYEVCRRIVSGAFDPTTDVVYTVSSNAPKEITDENLEPGSTFYYVVRATNISGASSWPDEYTVTIPW